ncbi:MAG: hypothetical protein H0V83_06090 [Rubrobacter sp.]|nr:hypothetical protein [Rubrobacter sp.]
MTGVKEEKAMQTSSLIRWSGLAAVLGGALWIAKVLYEMNDVTTYARDITDYMFFVVPLLLLVGLAGLYALDVRRAGQRGRVFLAGFLMGALGLMGISLSFGLWTLGTLSDLLWGIMIGLLPLGLGLMILGGSIIESGTLGRAKALPLVMGFMSILALALPPWNVAGVTVWALSGGGWVVLGVAIWASGNERAVRTARVQ